MIKIKSFPLIITLFILSLSFTKSRAGDIVFSDTDRLVFDNYASIFKEKKNLSIDEILQATALFFIGAPYVSQTLDGLKEERLVINLTEFDCVTYVETVIALSRTVKSGEISFDRFAKELMDIRYRNGIVNGYSSRFHYTSDWLYNNEKNNIIKSINEPNNSAKEYKKINFMSRHRQNYPQLLVDSVYDEILLVEEEINKRDKFLYLRKEDIVKYKRKTPPNMSVIGFVTTIQGLDISHIGFAYHNGDTLTLIHASSRQKRVVLEDKTSLKDYCLKNKSYKGITVAKVMEPLVFLK